MLFIIRAGRVVDNWRQRAGGGGGSVLTGMELGIEVALEYLWTGRKCCCVIYAC